MRNIDLSVGRGSEMIFLYNRDSVLDSQGTPSFKAILEMKG